jgi:hypothetical protein
VPSPARLDGPISLHNVQAVVNEHQIVLAAEITLSSPDFGQLEPMITPTRRELEQVGVSDTHGVAIADSGLLA